MNLRPITLTVALLAMLATALAPAASHANGIPTVIDLRYLEGLSNWGPQDATGRLELSFAEGYARVRAQKLPALERERYQAWLVNSETNDAISAGRFNVDASGTAILDGTLPLITNFGFDLFIITVEPEPDDAPQPTARRSIGGRFAVPARSPGDAGATGANGATGAAQTASQGTTPKDAGNRPNQLPSTGEAPLLPDAIRGAALLGAMAITGFLGLRLGRRGT